MYNNLFINKSTNTNKEEKILKSINLLKERIKEIDGGIVDTKSEIQSMNESISKLKSIYVRRELKKYKITEEDLLNSKELRKILLNPDMDNINELSKHFEIKDDYNISDEKSDNEVIKACNYTINKSNEAIDKLKDLLKTYEQCKIFYTNELNKFENELKKGLN